MDDQTKTQISSPYVQDALKEHIASRHPAPANISLLKQDCEFIAGVVMERFRKGDRYLPDEHTADILNRIGFIDYLRRTVSEADVTWIQELITEQRPELAGLMLSLLQKFDRRPDIHAFLVKKWEAGSPFLKAHVMWRLLDDEGMSGDRKREMFEFVLNNWAVFNEVSAKFLGTPETIVSAARTRLANPEYPVSKHWAYLCRVVEPASNKADAKTLLTEYLESSDEFTRYVARALLDRFSEDR